jgi:TIR domain-containing protein/D-alanyl-D-alanine carboxypeptidase-like protein
MPQEQVFISYSHMDKKWRDDLDTRLKPYLRGGPIVSWSDEQITAGSKWFNDIKSALADTKVAILLVSPDFLASDFIIENELGPLLKEADRGGVKILWVPVRASAYKETALRNYQAVIDPSKPLAGMTTANRDQAWVKICEEIKKAVNPSKEPFPEDSLKDAATESEILSGLDPRSASLVSGLDPRAASLAQQLIEKAKGIGIDARVIAGTRSIPQQEWLYTHGRAKPGPPVTNAKISVHNTGLAFVVGVFRNGSYVPEGAPEYAILGQIGKKLGLVWGGDWVGIPYEPHFETKDAKDVLKRLTGP